MSFSTVWPNIQPEGLNAPKRCLQAITPIMLIYISVNWFPHLELYHSMNSYLNASSSKNCIAI